MIAIFLTESRSFCCQANRMLSYNFIPSCHWHNFLINNLLEVSKNVGFALARCTKTQSIFLPLMSAVSVNFDNSFILVYDFFAPRMHEPFIFGGSFAAPGNLASPRGLLAPRWSPLRHPLESTWPQWSPKVEPR